MKVSTTEYQFAHGKMPRGEGIWAFTMYNADGSYLRDDVFCNGKYSDAKKQAIAFARSIGAVELSVGP